MFVSKGRFHYYPPTFGGTPKITGGSAVHLHYLKERFHESQSLSKFVIMEANEGCKGSCINCVMQFLPDVDPRPPPNHA